MKNSYRFRTRLLAMLLAFLMAFCLLPTAVFAEGEEAGDPAQEESQTSPTPTVVLSEEPIVSEEPSVGPSEDPVEEPSEDPVVSPAPQTDPITLTLTATKKASPVTLAYIAETEQDLLRNYTITVAASEGEAPAGLQYNFKLTSPDGSVASDLPQDSVGGTMPGEYTIECALKSVPEGYVSAGPVEFKETIEKATVTLNFKEEPFKSAKNQSFDLTENSYEMSLGAAHTFNFAATGAEGIKYEILRPNTKGFDASNISISSTGVVSVRSMNIGRIEVRAYVEETDTTKAASVTYAMQLFASATLSMSDMEPSVTLKYVDGDTVLTTITASKSSEMDLSPIQYSILPENCGLSINSSTGEVTINDLAKVLETIGSGTFMKATVVASIAKYQPYGENNGYFTDVQNSSTLTIITEAVTGVLTPDYKNKQVTIADGATNYKLIDGSSFVTALDAPTGAVDGTAVRYWLRDGDNKIVYSECDCVDTTGPEITLGYSINPVEAVNEVLFFGMLKNSATEVTVNVTVSDTKSGVDPDSLKYQLNEEEAQTPAAPTANADGSYSFSVKLPTPEGEADKVETDLTITAKDLAGNTSELTKQAVQDFAAPSIGFAAGEDELDGNFFVLMGGNGAITVTVTDNDQVASVRYQLGTEEAKTATLNDGAFTVTVDTSKVAATELAVTATDRAGNAAEKTLTIHVNDASTIPTTKDGFATTQGSVQGSNVQRQNSGTRMYWLELQVPGTAQAVTSAKADVERGSGSVSLSYQPNEDCNFTFTCSVTEGGYVDWKIDSAGFAKLPQGEYTLSLIRTTWGLDTPTVAKWTFVVDTTAPVLTAEYSPAAEEGSYLPKESYGADVETLTLSYSIKEASAVAGIPPEVTLTRTGFTTGSVAEEVTATTALSLDTTDKVWTVEYVIVVDKTNHITDGDYTVTIKYSDPYGNELAGAEGVSVAEGEYTAQFRICTSNLLTDVSYSENLVQQDGVYYTNGSATVGATMVTVDDITADGVKISPEGWTKDSSQECTYNWNTIYTDEGKYQPTFWYKDSTGNDLMNGTTGFTDAVTTGAFEVVPGVPAVEEVTDEEGNVTTPAQPAIPAVTTQGLTFPTIIIDKTAPVVAITAEVNGTTYGAGAKALSNMIFNADDLREGNSLTVTISATDAYLLEAAQGVNLEEEEPRESMTVTDGKAEETLTLSDGTYTILAGAADKAGNETTVTVENLMVDTQAPTELHMTAGQTTNMGFYRNSIALTFTAQDAVSGVDYFEWSYKVADGVSSVNKSSAGGTVDAVLQEDGSYSATVSLDAQARGTLTVTATDKAGNTTEGSVSVIEIQNNDGTTELVVVDNINPTATVGFTAPVQTANGKNYYAGGISGTITVREANFYADGYSVAINGNKVNPGWRIGTDVSTGTVNMSADGNYTVTITGADRSGNALANYQSPVMVIDTKAPEAAITVNGADANGNAYTDAAVLGVSFSDTNFDRYTLTIQRKSATSTETVKLLDGKITTTATGGTGTAEDLSHDAANDGIYTVTLTVYDFANHSTTVTSTFSVNRNGSVFAYDDALAELADSGIVTSVEEDLTITEVNADPLEDGSVTIIITRDGRPVATLTPAATPAPSSGNWYEYIYTISKDYFTEDGVYKISVTSKDKAGNLSENTENAISFYVDGTAPEITSVIGLENRRVEAEQLEVTYTVFDAIGLNTVTVLVNGEKVVELSAEDFADPNTYTGTFIIGEGLDQTVQIIVSDKAGTITDTNAEDFAPVYVMNKVVSVSSSSLTLFLNNKPALFGTIAGAAAVIAAAVALGIAKKKKKG